MKLRREDFKLYMTYSLMAIVFNVLFVIIHELGHALMSTIQGHEVILTLTSAKTVSGEVTLLAASGGLLFNILFAFFFITMFKKDHKLHWFLLIAANTFFVRILPSCLSLLKGIVYRDETNIADLLNINPMVIGIMVFVIMVSLFVTACKELSKFYEKKMCKRVLVITFTASIASFVILGVLEASGL